MMDSLRFYLVDNRAVKQSLTVMPVFLDENKYLITPISTGEQLLLMMILVRAIHDIKCPDSMSGKTYNNYEALEWFTETDPDPLGFSFDFIVNSLSPNPQSFKRKILDFVLDDKKILFNKMNYFINRTHAHEKETD